MNMKSKLMAAIAMLLVSTIMMTTASFAWFTISTAPEIKGMKATVTSNGNLEIALDNGYANGEAVPASATGNYNTWGNLVDLSTFPAVTLKPVKLTSSSADAPFAYAAYGADGRISSTPNATADSGKGVVTYADDTGTAVAFKVDFWLRTNVAGNVSLSVPADRGNGIDGEGSTMKNSNGIVSVVFNAGGTDVKATLTGEALTAENIVSFNDTEVKAGTAKKVTMYVFIDGETVHNKDAANATSEMAMNIQFAHSVTLKPMTGTTQTQTN